MAQSAKKLAELLDAWSSSGDATITENGDDLVADGLSAANATKLSAELGMLSWQYEMEDAAQDHVAQHDLLPDFEPYRVVAHKPSPASDQVGAILTNVGLKDWLSRPPDCSIVQIARLDKAFETLSVRFAPWDDTREFKPDTCETNPAKLVRETGTQRLVPNDLSIWIVRKNQELDHDNPSVLVWAELSAQALMATLCNEFEAPNTLILKGPPVSRYERNAAAAIELGSEGFANLQEAARWVFVLANEAETRHTFMTFELSRFAIASTDAVEFFKRAAAPALEGAKIAHQLGLQKISGDSLKALSDLRKAVSDEAAKLSDSTRSLTAAVTGALFGGIGLIVARVTAAADSKPVSIAVLIVGMVLFFYVVATIASGRQFVRIQRDLRDQWRDRLYRFIPAPEYEKMVTGPAKRAENAFHVAAFISVVLALALLVAIIVVSHALITEVGKTYILPLFAC